MGRGAGTSWRSACIVQGGFCGHLVNARFQNSQRAKNWRETDSGGVLPETTLCLWAPTRQPPGPLAVSGLAQGSMENDTRWRAGALN